MYVCFFFFLVKILFFCVQETSKDSLDETLPAEPEGVDSPATLGNKFISVDEEISISIKDEPSSPSSSVSSKLSEPTSSAGRPRGRGRGKYQAVCWEGDRR